MGAANPFDSSRPEDATVGPGTRPHRPAARAGSTRDAQSVGSPLNSCSGYLGAKLARSSAPGRRGPAADLGLTVAATRAAGLIMPGAAGQPPAAPRERPLKTKKTK